MTVDVAAQGAALVQAVLLGLAAGVLYDQIGRAHV